MGALKGQRKLYAVRLSFAKLEYAVSRPRRMEAKVSGDKEPMSDYGTIEEEREYTLKLTNLRK